LDLELIRVMYPNHKITQKVIRVRNPKRLRKGDLWLKTDIRVRNPKRLRKGDLWLKTDIRGRNPKRLRKGDLWLKTDIRVRVVQKTLVQKGTWRET
jgi:hypothetical protein